MKIPVSIQTQIARGALRTLSERWCVYGFVDKCGCKRCVAHNRGLTPDEENDERRVFMAPDQIREQREGDAVEARRWP